MANYFAAYFEHQHVIVWDIIVRDTLGPIAYLALMVVGLAVMNLATSRRPEAQLLVLFFFVGGLMAALSDLIYLTQTSYWTHGGWLATPTENMTAVGRSVEAINNLTTFTQYAGFLVLALGLLCLGRLWLSDVRLSSRLGMLTYLEAIALVGIVGASILHHDTTYDVLAFLTGALLGPTVAIWLGREVARIGSSPLLDATANSQ